MNRISDNLLVPTTKGMAKWSDLAIPRGVIPMNNR